MISARVPRRCARTAAPGGSAPGGLGRSSNASRAGRADRGTQPRVRGPRVVAVVPSRSTWIGDSSTRRGRTTSLEAMPVEATKVRGRTVSRSVVETTWPAVKNW
jgi:hypothetical protein